MTHNAMRAYSIWQTERKKILEFPNTKKSYCDPQQQEGLNNEDPFRISSKDSDIKFPLTKYSGNHKRNSPTIPVTQPAQPSGKGDQTKKK